MGRRARVVLAWFGILVGLAGLVSTGETSTDYLRVDPGEPIQIVRVRWHPQKWKVNGRNQWIELPEFEATIHVSHLEVIR